MANRLIELRINKAEYLSGFAGSKFKIQLWDLPTQDTTAEYQIEMVPSSTYHSIDMLVSEVAEITEFTGTSFYLKLYRTNDDDTQTGVGDIELTVDWDGSANKISHTFTFDSVDLNDDYVSTEIKIELEVNPSYTAETLISNVLDKTVEITNYISTRYPNQKFEGYINKAFSLLSNNISVLNEITEEELLQNDLLTITDGTVYKFNRVATCVSLIQSNSISYSDEGELNSVLSQITEYYENYLPKDAGFVRQPWDGGGGDEETGTKEFNLNSMTNARIQSSELYMEACGSDNSGQVEGITQGLHLRWALTGDIGKLHLPKGNYAKAGKPYETIAGYSENPDDFVYIYRTPYINRVQTTIDFDQAFSDIEVFTQTRYNSIAWVTLRFTINSKNISTIFKKNNSFDTAFSQYFTLTGTGINSNIYTTNNFYDLIKNYTGSIEILENNGKPFFYVKVFSEVDLQNNITNPIDILRIASSSYNNPYINYKNVITINNLNAGIHLLTDEHFTDNSFQMKLEQLSGKTKKIVIEFYEDFIPNRSWTEIKDGFALTENDIIADNRLDPGNYYINQSWPKYNDEVVVKKQNYIDKWQNSNDGTKKAVIDYLTNSRDVNNPYAKLELQNSISTSVPKITICMLEILKILSLDFHNARMLGFGHIDKTYPDSRKKYIYLAYYKAPNAPNNQLDESGNIISISASFLEHLYMTLPTGETDYRLPFTPEIKNFTHEFTGEDECSSDELFDDDGYYKYGNERIININKNDLTYEKYFSNWEIVLNDSTNL
ncbi:MAG: hypothetical protein NTU43_01660, partial [Bacteroidetes bacterium]|nr:hypothetical protein [Bacteroidota bacterium]